MITELIGRLTTRKQRSIDNVTTPYLSLLRQLAGDEQIDEDEIEATIEAAGKSIGDLTANVATMKKRLRSRRKLDQLPKMKSDYAAAQAENDRLQREFNALALEYQAKFKTLRETKGACEQEILWEQSAISELLLTCMDQRLLDREAELTARQRKLAEQKRELESILSGSLPGTAAYILQGVIRNKDIYKDAKGPDQLKAQQYWDGCEPTLQASIDRRRAELQTVLGQLQQVTAELAEVGRLKLNP